MEACLSAQCLPNWSDLTSGSFSAHSRHWCTLYSLLITTLPDIVIRAQAVHPCALRDTIAIKDTTAESFVKPIQTCYNWIHILIDRIWNKLRLSTKHAHKCACQIITRKLYSAGQDSLNPLTVYNSDFALCLHKLCFRD